MSEVPYDPSGKIQPTGFAAYAQNASRPGSPGSGPKKEGTAAIIFLGIVAILQGVFHVFVSILFFAEYALALDITLVGLPAPEPGQAPPAEVPSTLETYIDLNFDIAFRYPALMGAFILLIGLVCLAGGIGILLRAKWGWVVGMILGGLLALEGLMVLTWRAWTMLLMFQLNYDLQFVPVLRLLLDSLLVLGLGFLAITVLRKHADQFS